MQVNYNNRSTFRVNLSEISKFFEINPFSEFNKNIELGRVLHFFCF